MSNSMYVCVYIYIYTYIYTHTHTKCSDWANPKRKKIRGWAREGWRVAANEYGAPFGVTMLICQKAVKASRVSAD